MYHPSQLLIFFKVFMEIPLQKNPQLLTEGSMNLQLCFPVISVQHPESARAKQTGEDIFGLCLFGTNRR